MRPGAHSGQRKRSFSFPLHVRHWGDPARVPRSGPFNLRRERCHPNLHPPQAESWIGFGHLASQPTGWSYQTHTHTRTHAHTHTRTHAHTHTRTHAHTHTRTHAPAARLRENQSSDCSLEAAQTQSLSSWHVGAVPGTQKATP